MTNRPVRAAYAFDEGLKRIDKNKILSAKTILLQMDQPITWQWAGPNKTESIRP
jgi:hypothetical protein